MYSRHTEKVTLFMFCLTFFSLCIWVENNKCTFHQFVVLFTCCPQSEYTLWAGSEKREQRQTPVYGNREPVHVCVFKVMKRTKIQWLFISLPKRMIYLSTSHTEVNKGWQICRWIKHELTVKLWETPYGQKYWDTHTSQLQELIGPFYCSTICLGHACKGLKFQ